ncbi:MAG: peptide ABC transporter substrate-binding protein [Armatimonadota bacterium]
MNRRFLRFALAVCMGLAVLVSGMGASAAPAGESVFRVYMVGDARTLDPAVASDFPTASNAYLLQLRLVSMDGTGKVFPMGARSWTITGGGLVYTFEMDPRAKFHNGKPVTAADWKWSLDRLAQPETGSGSAEAVLGGVIGYDAVRSGATRSLAGVRVVNPTTLQIALRPDGRGGFINRLTSYNASVLNRDEVEAGGRDWSEKSPAGAGPFKLVRWERNTRFVYAANKDYHLGAPKVDTVEMLIVPSAITRLNLYEAGQLDMTDVPLADYRRISGDARYSDQLKVFPRAQSLFLGLNAAVYEPFRDVRVRRAVTHAIDRERIARTVFFGFYTPAYGITPPQVPGVDANQRTLPYNPDTAKRLLAESGFAGRMPPLDMAVNPAAPDYQMAAEAIAAMLKDVLGIEVRLQRQEFAAYRAALNRRNVFPSFMQGWSAAYLDFGYYLDLLLDGRSGLNFANYRNTEFDRFVDQANTARSEADREGHYRQAEQIAMNDAALVPVVFTRWAMLVKPYVRGFDGSPLSLGWTDLTRVEVRR